jgi:UDP-arabinose 4-epimerase
MRNKGVSQIIFSSTCATYGIPHTIPISEDHPQNPINPYGHSKLMNERMLADLNVAYGIHSISLRYFNAVGADPEGEIGEKRDAEGHLIPLVLQVAAGARPNITIFGIDYDTPDGTCIRDYVHVTDLAEAHVLALLALSRYKSASYNLGTGRGFSVREVIRTAQSITGQNITAKEGPRRAGDPPHLVADASRVSITSLQGRNGSHLLENPDFELIRHGITFPISVEVDEIYNLACPASPIHYQRDPVQTTKTSVHEAINVLGLAKRLPF